jgi:hypothetical protein
MGFGMWVHRQKYALLLVLFAAMGVAIPSWLLSHGYHVPVGVYIAIMGLVTAVATFHDEPSRVEKFGWILFATALMVAEIRNLYVADREQAHTFSAISESMGATKTGLDGAVGQLQTLNEQQRKSLEASQTAELNTRPFADIEFETAQPANSLPITANGHSRFTVFYKNVGNAAPANTIMDFRDYVGPIDNAKFQKSMAADFDKWWTTSQHRKINPVPPGRDAFGSFDSHTFTEGEVQALNDHTSTLYFIMRWTYTDNRGNWIGDVCLGYQDIRHDLVVGHECIVHTNHRYPAR